MLSNQKRGGSTQKGNESIHLDYRHAVANVFQVHSSALNFKTIGYSLKRWNALPKAQNCVVTLCYIPCDYTVLPLPLL